MSQPGTPTPGPIRDLVTVIETWRLPSGSNPGYYTISVDEEPAKKQRQRHDAIARAVLRSGGSWPPDATR